jgi:hypothetical protein
MTHDHLLERLRKFTELPTTLVLSRAQLIERINMLNEIMAIIKTPLSRE